MAVLTSDDVAELFDACLRLWTPEHVQADPAEARKAAAAAFYQAGLARHRHLFLGEILDDYRLAGSKSDPEPAVFSAGILPRPTAEFVREVGWYYETAIALHRDFAEAHYNLATLRRREGRLDQASSLFARAADLAPHPRAQPHASVNANALWEQANLAAARPDTEESARLYGRALKLLGNFGPEHVRFPRLLQRLGRHEEALQHYSLLLAYSHRYASEYIEPAWEPREKLAMGPDGGACDPAEVTLVGTGGARRYYWAHLHIAVPEADPEPDPGRLLKILRGRWPFRRARLARLRLRCALDPAAFTS